MYQYSTDPANNGRPVQPQWRLGEQYRNRIGIYTVIARHGDTLTVEYNDGKIDTLHIADQIRIMDRMRIDSMLAATSQQKPQKRRQAKPKPTKQFEWWTNWAAPQWEAFGFAAHRSFLQARMRSGHRDQFAACYVEETGSPPDCTRCIISDDYRAISMQVLITASDKDGYWLSTMWPDQVKRIAPDDWRITSTAFCWTLVRHGFRLGRQDADTIRALVPAEYLDAFAAGEHRAMKRP